MTRDTASQADYNRRALGECATSLEAVARRPAWLAVANGLDSHHLHPAEMPAASSASGREGRRGDKRPDVPAWRSPGRR